MKCNYLVLSAVLALVSLQSQATTSILGSAESFAVLGGATVTNTGLTHVTGNLGVSPGSAVTGFPPGLVTGTIYAGDSVAALAQSDLTRAYVGLAAMQAGSNLTGNDLGGLTLASGVYRFDTAAQLTGMLTLDAQGKDNAYWVFQIGSTLTTAGSSSIAIVNLGLNDGKNDGVFWQVGSSATLGTNTAFEGNILSLTSITLNTGAIMKGRAFARNGAVTLDSNGISIFAPNGGPGYSGGLEYNPNGGVVAATAPIPEPVTIVLLALGLASLFIYLKRIQPQDATAARLIPPVAR